MGMPSWLENIVFYEIYPQTFLDTDGDGIGNIQGIIRKLDYIKNLGCDGIWLNPCFASPFYDAGYDVADYKKVAPRLSICHFFCHFYSECAVNFFSSYLFQCTTEIDRI